MNSEKITVIILGVIYLPIFFYHFILFLLGIKRPDFNFRRFLKFNLYSILIIGLIMFVLSHTNYLNYESPIPYKRVENITFKNFKGLEFFKTELYGSKYFAYVYTSIDSEISSDSITIESHFHPSKSYVYNINSGSKELLTHEIYHFKITELFARKAKKDISENKNISTDKIEEIIENTKIREREFQKKYDYETFHSYVYRQQKKYERNVDSLLYLLKKFENPKISINDKK